MNGWNSSSVLPGGPQPDERPVVPAKLLEQVRRGGINEQRHYSVRPGPSHDYDRDLQPVPKTLYCWRCKIDLPMLDPGEWQKIGPPGGNLIQAIKD